MTGSDELLSALVVLRPGPGRELGDRGAITAENVHESLPSQDAVASTEAWFRERGFEVGPGTGASFSIAAPRSTFERIFAPLQVGGTPAARSAQTAEGELELPLDDVPDDVRANVQAVTFTPPPEFGPTDYA
jgi:hypothetical protein